MCHSCDIYYILHVSKNAFALDATQKQRVRLPIHWIGFRAKFHGTPRKTEFEKQRSSRFPFMEPRKFMEPLEFHGYLTRKILWFPLDFPFNRSGVTDEATSRPNLQAKDKFLEPHLDSGIQSPT